MISFLKKMRKLITEAWILISTALSKFSSNPNFSHSCPSSFLQFFAIFLEISVPCHRILFGLPCKLAYSCILSGTLRLWYFYFLPRYLSSHLLLFRCCMNHFSLFFRANFAFRRILKVYYQFRSSYWEFSCFTFRI